MTAPDEVRQRGGKKARSSVTNGQPHKDAHTHASTSDGVPAPPPTEGDLPFTRAQVRDAIPAHLFVRNTWKSLGYVARDLLMWAVLVCVIYRVDRAAAPGPAGEAPQLPRWAQAAAWAAYFWLAGWVATGLWVLAHECGHGGFSDHSWVNRWVGWTLHSALYVPFHSWRITHAQHHAATNDIDNDAVFVPPTRSEGPSLPLELPVIAHIFSLFELTGSLLFGFPLYLFFNLSGPAKHRGKRRDHFSPSASMFEAAHAADVLWSDAGLLLVLVATAAACYYFGALNVFMYYGMPVIITTMNLVLVTYLQHTDVFVPHIRGSKASWLRGALLTVDRHFGWGADWFWHHITDSHVVHHLFSDMPFYNAIKATPYVRDFVGKYYLRDDTPVPAALWRAWTKCRFIEDDGEVVYYKSKLTEEPTLPCVA